MSSRCPVRFRHHYAKGGAPNLLSLHLKSLVPTSPARKAQALAAAITPVDFIWNSLNPYQPIPREERGITRT